MYDERPALGFDDSSDEETHAQYQHQAERKDKARLSKEERMLGQWDSDDDSYDSSSRRRGARGKATNRHLENPFNPSSVPADKEAPEAESDGASSDDASASDSSDSDSSSDGGSDGDSNSGPSKSASTTLAPRGKQFESVSRAHNKDFGKFASGAVWNMMAKMGYKPGEGLGKHGDGLVEPIQVTLRRAGEGISFSGSEKTPESKASLASVGKGRQKGRPVADGVSRSLRAASAQSQAQVRARQRTEYKTLEELQRRTDTQLQEMFIDMTSNTQVGSFSELVAKRMPIDEKNSLISDVRLGMDLALSRMDELRREDVAAQTKIGSLTGRIQRLSLSVERRSARIDYLQEIKDTVREVQLVAKASQTGSAETAKGDLRALYGAYERLHQTAQRIEQQHSFNVWDELRLETVVTSTMYSHLEHILLSWSPVTHPNLVEDVLVPLYPYVNTHDDSVPNERLTPFESLLNRTLIPRLKQFILTQWDPMVDGLCLLLSRLPPVIMAAASGDISTRLMRHVSAIEPSAALHVSKSQAPDTEPTTSTPQPLADLHIGRVVIPWLPYIHDRSELVSSVRRKLCAALDHWTPTKGNNGEIISLLLPWMEICQGKELRRLSIKVSDRLDVMLRAEFEVNAQRQVVWPFKVLMKWHSVLPFDDWFLLVKRRVLGKFTNYLRTWLEDQSANYADVADWYWQWKQLYPPEIFALESVQKEFRGALVLMSYAVSYREASLPKV
ncbi:hypothetical protein EV174_002553 [Coemansia sp. RSA 2320]|nr:hypothetical protein EV174_002553 [Coemansia sp. RSA 2320]